MGYADIAVPILAAIFGGVFVALLQPVWTNFIGKKSHLTVRVKFFRFELPRFLNKSISEYINNYKINIKPTKEYRELFSQVRFLHGLTVVNIENHSKNTISEVTLRIEDNEEFLADFKMDGHESSGCFLGRTLSIGDLRPNSKCEAFLWHRPALSERSFGDPLAKVIVSARDYDKIRYSLSPIDYLISRYFFIRRKYIWVGLAVFWLILIVWMAYNAVKGALSG